MNSQVGWQQALPIIARMSGSTSWGGQGVRHEGAGPQGGPHALPINPPLFPPYFPQGVISAAKELDYEICHGRYTLTVTATDQCPIWSRRLTSTTTVRGWVGHSPNLGVGEYRAQKAPVEKGGRKRLCKRNP